MMFSLPSTFSCSRTALLVVFLLQTTPCHKHACAFVGTSLTNPSSSSLYGTTPLPQRRRRRRWSADYYCNFYNDAIVSSIGKMSSSNEWDAVHGSMPSSSSGHGENKPHNAALSSPCAPGRNDIAHHHRHELQLPLVSSSGDPAPPPFTSWDDLLDTRTRSGKTLASVPRFVEFCSSHKYYAMKMTDGRQTHVPNLLQGGRTTGPLGKTKYGQTVRVLGAYPHLTAKPRHDIQKNGTLSTTTTTTTNVFRHDDLSWVIKLQEDYLPIIQNELRSVLPTLPEEAWQSLRTHRGKDWSDGTGWSHVALIDNFRFQESNMKYFPETMRILRDESVVGMNRRMGPRLTAIARQKSGSGIPEHYDYMNWMLTLHTALRGPKKGEGEGVGGCGIIINGTKWDWIVGDPIVMDTTFPHETYNDSDEDLYLLMVDFWHPDLSVDEIDALRAFFAVNSGV